MKLCFRGRVYSQFPKHISTVASDKTASYRGHQYTLRVPVATELYLAPDCQMSAAIYKYRGVSYVVEHRQYPTKQKQAHLRC